MTVLLLIVQAVHGQSNAGDLITLNFPDDIKLAVVVRYVSERLGVNILYDEKIANETLTVRAPQPVPQASLLALLESALQLKGLTLSEGDNAQWKQIVPFKRITANAKPPSQAGDILKHGPDNLAVTQVVHLQHASATGVGRLVASFLTQPGGNMTSVEEQGILIISDMAWNVKRIIELIKLIDRPRSPSDVRFVPIIHSSADELSKKIKRIMDTHQPTRAGSSNRPDDKFDITSDTRTNQLILMGAPTLLDKAEQIARSLDVDVPDSQNPVQFYKLLHTTAQEVLDTLTRLEDDGGIERLDVESLFNAPNPDKQSRPAGADANPATTSEPPAIQNPPNTRRPQTSSKAKIAADVNTNSIIVVAEPAMQRVYGRLIRRLDQRRPQVLIETTIVTLDTSDDFRLGVEIAIDGSFGASDFLTFSSFGLSSVSEAGRLTIIPGTGFNGAVVSTDVADIVIQALKRTGKARVVSAPRILVNDNAEGQLSATSQEPFESVNASDTVATTSFGGFVEAGTSITLTPHISEGNYLRLDYTIELSSFSGERVEDLPPPRVQNIVESSVTIPDGDTIIVGGLTRRDSTRSKSAVPILGEIPWLETLFSSTITEDQQTTLFVFVRPIILRKDRFEDLKYLSSRDVAAADMPVRFPASEPLPVH